MRTGDEADMVNHPPHYTSHPSGVECITVTEHMGFCVGNAVKYLWRAGAKGAAVEDLKKARWYIDREIRRLSGEIDDAPEQFATNTDAEAHHTAAKLVALVEDLEAQLRDIPAQIARAVMAEREACAATADGFRIKVVAGDWATGHTYAATTIADVIRNRPAPAEWVPPCDVCRAQAAKGGG